MDLSDVVKQSIIDTATCMADAARPIALSYFRTESQAIENKLINGFDPVTIADKEIELIFRKVLSEQRPDDGVIGEEFPKVPSRSGLTWILDPIDGTRAFISGAPTWGMLIAVHDGSKAVFGVIDQPYTGERFIGGFGQSELQSQGKKTNINVRACSKLKDATLFSTMPQVGDISETELFNRVARECKLTRFGLDCYAYALLALGQIDLVIEAGLNIYDIQGPLAVVEAAGGIVTNWQGETVNEGGQVIAAGDPEVHAAAIKLLNN
jgi:histidinol phosphatase-like enzyme (inositol monophosphatase family)